LQTVKLLFGLSAGRCSICRHELILESTGSDPIAIQAEIAHICGESDDGPRPCPSMTKQERNSYNNLLLLCPTCHSEVDLQPNKYSIEKLHKIKNQHEEWVQGQFIDVMPNISFAELEVVTNAILELPSRPTTDFSIVPPLEKIQKNNLSRKVEAMIMLGTGKSLEVEEYLTETSKIDTRFPERLKAGFVAEYNRLLIDGFEGDNLFEALLFFSSRNKRDFLHQAAGLAVLVYLFHKCEIFEK
jgi:hypothetical protein